MVVVGRHCLPYYMYSVQCLTETLQVLTFFKCLNIYFIVCLSNINAPVTHQCSCVMYMYMTNGTGFEFSFISH